MRIQNTRHILMVRPANFAFNEETAANNAFQSRDLRLSPSEIRRQAVREFDSFVKKLQSAGVNVIVARDSTVPVKPDAVFPNNWITFHQEGFIITYPMYAPTRRRERRRQIIEMILEQGFQSNRRVNFEFNEKLNRYLEGTGSVVFDHINRLAYACTGPRTDAELLDELCAIIGYRPVLFRAVDARRQDIYHTNVLMAMGETFVVICMDTVADPGERAQLTAQFAATNKEIVDITLGQMNSFAGNMLQVRNDQDQPILVMSTQAYESLRPDQIAVLERHTALLHSPLNTIELYGGGSARCMMAEIFLPYKPT